MSVLRPLWANVTLGFWFLPGLLVAAFAAAGIALVEIDRGIGHEGLLGRTFDGDADAAHSILGAIATGFITVAGVAFSITIVTLQLVSSQYSPLALTTFLSDRVNQLVVGMFVGIVVYCLLVLRTVRADGDGAAADAFVPRLAVTVAIGAALLGLALVVLFVHHLATSIQVSSIAERVGRTTLADASRLYPERFAAAEDAAAEALLERWGAEAPPGLVYPGRPGYVQAIDADRAVEGLPPGTRVHLRARPGDFVTPGQPLVALWPAARADEEGARTVRAAFTVNDQRSDVQDVGFGVRKLADVALRALSPSLNDPTTAVTCVGYVRAVLEHLADRAFPARVRRVEDGPEVVVERPSFAEHLEPLVEIARHAREEPRVRGAVLDALEGIERLAREAGAREHADAAAAARDAVAAGLERGERE